MKRVLIIVALVLMLVGVSYNLYETNERYKDLYHTSLANEKALTFYGDSLLSRNRALSLTINQIELSNDSLLKALNKTRKELNIKDKELKSLLSIKEEATRTDTVFIQNIETLIIDTLLGDKWFNTKLSITPTFIAVSPSIVSDKSVFVYTRRETVEPPKKCFISRWFQRKHTILECEVVEKNPYIKQTVTRYISVVGNNGERTELIPEYK